MYIDKHGYGLQLVDGFQSAQVHTRGPLNVAILLRMGSPSTDLQVCRARHLVQSIFACRSHEFVMRLDSPVRFCLLHQYHQKYHKRPLA